MLRGIAIGLVLALLALRAQAADLSHPFTLRCNDVDVKAFRFIVTSNGKVISNSWSEGEKISGEWVFQWDPSKGLILDGKQLTLMGRGKTWLVAISGATSTIAGGIWSYAINTELQTAVASQVNTHKNSLGAGLKARSVQFQCGIKWGSSHE